MLIPRIITAIVLVSFFLYALFEFSAPAWFLMSVSVAALGAWEWAGLMRQSHAVRVLFALMISLLVLAVGLQAGMLMPDGEFKPEVMLPWWGVSAGFWSVLVTGWLKNKWSAVGTLRGWLAGVVVLVPTALALAVLRGVGPVVLLACMAIVWIADIGAYFSGRAFGKHKLAPSISPGKSWEGAIGGAIAVLIYGVLLGQQAFPEFSHRQPLVVFIVGLVVFTAFSVIGDLFESMIKRQAGIKDSSQLLPGHGGVLDRIDSLTSTLPLLALLVHVL